MNANNHQEFEFTDAARQGGLSEDASTTLQKEAYDGKLPAPARPSSTVALGNLELIQTGPVATDARVQQLQEQPADGRVGEADQQSKPIDRPQQPQRVGETGVLPRPAEPRTALTETAVERGGTPFEPIGAENDSKTPLEDVRRVGVQEMINLEKADKVLEAIKNNDMYAIKHALKDLQSHPECIDFVRDYLQKELGLKRDEVQIVFNRGERGFSTLQLELCKIEWPREGERRPPSGTRLIIDSEGSASGYEFTGWGWTTMNAKEALKQFYAPAPPKPGVPTTPTDVALVAPIGPDGSIVLSIVPDKPGSTKR